MKIPVLPGEQPAQQFSSSANTVPAALFNQKCQKSEQKCHTIYIYIYIYIPCATKPFIFVGFATKPWVFIQIMPKPWVFIANLGFEAKNIILLLICCYAVVCPHTPISHLRKRQEIVQLVVTDLVFALFVKQKLG